MKAGLRLIGMVGYWDVILFLSVPSHLLHSYYHDSFSIYPRLLAAIQAPTPYLFLDSIQVKSTGIDETIEVDHQDNMNVPLF
jgi:hypothetical protein